jgi:hypothetical protein
MKLDNEVSGNGNSYTTLFRELDVRLGRWWAVDPKSEKMPWQSSYNSMDNNPIWYNDPLGDWVKGKGFWKNITNSDAKLKAKDYALKNGGTATRKGFGKWDVTKVNENRISNNEGKTRLEYIIENRTFTKENSNDLTDHGNAFFNFMGLLDYGISNLRGNKDNMGVLEGKKGAKTVAEELDYISQVSGYIPGGEVVSDVTGGLSAFMKSAIEAQEGNPNLVRNTIIRSVNIGIGAYAGKKLENSKYLRKVDKSIINGAINQGSGIFEDQYTQFK